MIGVAVLAAVSVFVIWRQYGDDKHRDVTDLNARVVLVGAVVDSYLSGGISTLDSIAAAPSVVESSADADERVLQAAARRTEAGSSTAASAGSTARGKVMASSSGVSLNVADRLYFQRVMKTGRPYVSSGLVGRSTEAADHRRRRPDA